MYPLLCVPLRSSASSAVHSFRGSTSPNLRTEPLSFTRGMLMIEAAHPALSGWENFYVIVGSSAAALIGLQFVVIALIKDTRLRTTTGSISAFGTPTIVHLGSALVISALMSTPC